MQAAQRYNTADIQLALIAKGYKPGEADGIMGRNTIAAIKSFQTANGLVPDGIVGPFTAGKLLDNTGNPDYLVTPVMPPWFELALRKKGLHENRDHKELMQFLKSDGDTVGDPAVVPWCGDFVETCIAVTCPNEVLPSNPYLARTWAKFGKSGALWIGAVAVFWRTSKEHSTDGHVGFVAGRREDGALFILGGNQSNSVSVAPVAGNRLLDLRWPKGYASGRPAPMMKGGVLSYNEA